MITSAVSLGRGLLWLHVRPVFLLVRPRFAPNDPRPLGSVSGTEFKNCIDMVSRRSSNSLDNENGSIGLVEPSEVEEGVIAVHRSDSAIIIDEAREDLPSVIFRMPNTAFGISMGLAGHAIMWKGMRNADFVKERITEDIVDVLNSMCWYLAATVFVIT